MTRFYRFFHMIFYPFFQLFFPFCAHGLENIPKDRPVVFCGNHSHAVDPILICLSLPRKFPICIMAKKELMDMPLVGWFLRGVGAFGVDRGNSDLAAVKTAIKTIRDGASLLIFPEGTRVQYEGQVQPKGGAVMIAIRTHAVLLPVYSGTPRKLFHRTHIIFGEPYEPKTETRHGTAEEYQSFANEVVRRAYELGRTWESKE